MRNKKQKPIIEIRNVGKKYLLRKKIKKNNWFSDGSKSEDFWALKNINLKIFAGDRVGIVGPNGAGKTTLLKIMSGIVTPTTGTIKVRGRVVALTDIQAGFHPELTGLENIRLNGVLIGMRKQEIIEKLEEMVDFAGLGKFIDQPFFTYSAGMKFRLAFSVAMASRCDVLILDEIFISGDSDFQKKTADIILEAQKKNKSMVTITSSHVVTLLWGFSNTFFQISTGRLNMLPRKKVWSMLNDYDRVWRKKFKLDRY